MTRHYHMNLNGNKNTQTYCRDEALEVFGLDDLWRLDAGRVVELGDGTKVVDLVAFFEAEVA